MIAWSAARGRWNRTTMLRQIVGLLRPTEGEVRLFGEPLSRATAWNRPRAGGTRHAVPARRAILGFQRLRERCLSLREIGTLSRRGDR